MVDKMVRELLAGLVAETPALDHDVV
jgi:hypothetical protein